MLNLAKNGSLSFHQNTGQRIILQLFKFENKFLPLKTRKNVFFSVNKTLGQRFGENLKTLFLQNFAANFLLFCVFTAF